MEWIRLDSSYPRHRKVLRLVRNLGPLAELYPIRLWLWALEQSPDGSLRDIDAEEMALIVGHKGDADKLWSAMSTCGFIEQDGEQSWRLRSWHEHQGILIERAERNAERMRRARAAGEVEPEPAPRPVRPAKPVEVEIPTALDTPAFRAEWGDWMKYKSERREAYKPIGAKKVLDGLAKRGADEAVAALRMAMERGWMGPAASEALERDRRARGPRPTTVAAPRAEIAPWRTKIMEELTAEKRWPKDEPLCEQLIIAIKFEAKDEADARARVEQLLTPEVA